MRNLCNLHQKLSSALCTISDHENVGRCWGVLWEIMKYDDFTLAVETNVFFDVSKQACSGNFQDSCSKIVLSFKRFHCARDNFRCFCSLYKFYTCAFCLSACCQIWHFVYGFSVDVWRVGAHESSHYYTRTQKNDVVLYYIYNHMFFSHETVTEITVLCNKVAVSGGNKLCQWSHEDCHLIFTHV